VISLSLLQNITAIQYMVRQAVEKQGGGGP